AAAQAGRGGASRLASVASVTDDRPRPRYRGAGNKSDAARAALSVGRAVRAPIVGGTTWVPGSAACGAVPGEVRPQRAGTACATAILGGQPVAARATRAAAARVRCARRASTRGAL